MPAAGPADSADPVAKMRGAVRGFRGKHALKADGFVGPRTEGAMVRVWGDPPPGHSAFGHNASTLLDGPPHGLKFIWPPNWTSSV